MKKYTILKVLLILLSASNFVTAQNYIKADCKLNNGENLNGLIKNNFENDDEFVFFKENNQEKKINIKDIQELIIDGKEEYISKMVDFHPNRLLTVQQINDSKTTDLKLRESKQVLLKLLVKGDVNLYQTYINDVSLYYYKKSSEPNLEYLEYFKYKLGDNVIKANNLFQRALLKNVNCSNHIANSYQYIDYDEKDLIKVVNKNNICVNGGSTILSNVSDSQNKFRLYAFGGVKLISGNIESDAFISKNNFSGNHVSPNIGFEFSYLGASRNKKAEIFTRLDYSTINFSQSNITSTFMGITTNEENIQFESSVLEVLLGYRYNFNSLEDTKKSNFALDFGINTSIPFNKSLVYRNRAVGISNFQETDLSELINDVVFGVSIGTSYTYLKKYTLEARYTINSSYTDNLSFLSAEFSNLNIGFKYLILD